MVKCIAMMGQGPPLPGCWLPRCKSSETPRVGWGWQLRHAAVTRDTWHVTRTRALTRDTARCRGHPVVCAIYTGWNRIAILCRVTLVYTHTHRVTQSMHLIIRWTKLQSPYNIIYCSHPVVLRWYIQGDTWHETRGTLMGKHFTVTQTCRFGEVAILNQKYFLKMSPKWNVSSTHGGKLQKTLILFTL